MSNMLEQAIVDARALKEAAIKNAETAIVEHYALDIKEAVEKLIEQPVEDEFGDVGPSVEETPFTQQVPHAAVEGEDFAPGEDQPIEIDFDDLQARLEAEEEEIATGGAEEMVDREEELAAELTPEEETEVSLQESLLYEILGEISEEDGLSLEEADIEAMLEDILAEDEEEEEEDTIEEKKADKDYDGDGKVESSEEEWKGSRTKAIKKATQKENKLVNENKQLLKSTSTHKKQIKTLKEQNNKYRSLVSTMKEKLDEVNLSNAKLLYTNRILTSDSLNERQKNKIVEAVRSAKTVEEAKTIFDTLQSAVGSVSAKREPKSLSEVVRKRSAAFLPRREEKRVDPFAARMKILAGIKKN